MWGNRLGWQISGVIVAAAVVFVIWLNAQLAITAPTALSLDPKNIAALSPPWPAAAIVDQTEAGDAGPIYRDAMEAYADRPEASDEFVKNPGDNPPLPIKRVLEATHKATMNLLANNPAKYVNYQSEQPQLENLNNLGLLMDRVGLSLRIHKKPDEARKYFQAVYAMGFKLYGERVNHDEYQKGLGLLNEATTGLAECEPENSPWRQELESQEKAMADYDQERVMPIYKVLSSADPQTIAFNAGDVFELASKAQDRMVRVEAILKLGRYRFDADRMGDQLGASRYLRRLAGDTDPVIQAAASAGLGLTLEQYRAIH